jgi:hypothetical protein
VIAILAGVGVTFAGPPAYAGATCCQIGSWRLEKDFGHIFVSENIAKGAMWLEELGNFLDQACAVLVCLNRDALRSPWVHYEVGAIANAANALEERQASANEGVHLARAFTPLLGVKPGEIEGPLAAFQSTVADDAKDMRRLIDTFTLELPADQQTTVWRKELDQTGLRHGQGSTSDSERSRYPSWARPFQLSIGYSGVGHSRSRRPSA